MLAVYLFVSFAPGFYVGWRVAGTQAWASMERDKRRWLHLRGRTRPAADNYGVGVFFGVLALFVWPFVVLVWLVGRDEIGRHRLVYIPPQYRRQMYEERIRELEREVGVS